MEPFRFVHVARLLLDHPLCATGPLPDSIRPIVEDATLLAWDRVVDVCLEESVDFLLVTGGEADLFEAGLRGPAALVRGFERLTEHGIPVVTSGPIGARTAHWPSGLLIPDDVHRLDESEDIAIRRDDRVLAIVTAEDVRNGPTASGTPRLLKLTVDDESAFRIVVAPSETEWAPIETRGETDAASEAPRVDYHASGGSAIARSFAVGRRMFYDPGPPQGLRPTELGPRGCALVTVRPDGHWEQVFVPTAAVRYESIQVAVTPEQSRDDLLLEMIVALERLPRCPSDRVWLVAAKVTGSGPCLEMLGNERERETFVAELHADHGIHDVQIHIHSLRIHPAVETPQKETVDDSLIRDFDRRLDERVAHPHWALQRSLDESRLNSGPWTEPLRALLGALDTGDIAAEARRLGREWFATEEEPSR